jgi:diguanylate cyclase (GGDEF)-like protein/hemerythrin-like metal-binding protein
VVFVGWLLLAIVLQWAAPHAAAGLEPVRLQLKWDHQFQFAGYYAAQELGYYRQAGLEVTIMPGKPGDDPVQQVLRGKADFGVGTSDLLLVREKGAPVVALAAIFQHSPLSLMMLKSKDLQSIHDLVGRNVMIESGSAELLAYLRSEGVSPDRLVQLTHSFNVQDLLTGKVAAMSVYGSVEPIEVLDAGLDYLLYSPRSAGIDFYSDILFTSEGQLKSRPQTVRAFREASLRGWDYAMQHPEELVQLIYRRYSKRNSLEHLRFEANQMVPLIQASLVEIGHMHPGRWRHMAEVYAGLGMMRPDFDLKGFLYNPNPQPLELRWLYYGVAAVLVLVLIPTVTAIKFVRLSQRLSTTIAESRRAHEALEQSHRQLEALSITDGLTGLANRRRFDAVLAQEHARHARSEAIMSLVMLDIDHFKAYNDCYGHVQGDECLRQVARVIAGSIVRSADFAARYGGEEFVCILPDTEQGGAIAIAEKMRRGIMALAMPHAASATADCVTASFGVVTIRCTGQETASVVVEIADAMLYKAKANGRNRVEADASRCDQRPLPVGMGGGLVQLAWKESFDSGDPTIDMQHKELFCLANILLETVLSDQGLPEILVVMTELLQRIEQHFRDEEAILARLGYAGLPDHAAEHARLLATGQELAQALTSGTAVVGDVFKYLVYDVVLHHMIAADRAFFPLVRAGAEESPIAAVPPGA